MAAVSWTMNEEEPFASFSHRFRHIGRWAAKEMLRLTWSILVNGDNVPLAVI